MDILSMPAASVPNIFLRVLKNKKSADILQRMPLPFSPPDIACARKLALKYLYYFIPVKKVLAVFPSMCYNTGGRRGVCGEAPEAVRTQIFREPETP